MNNLHRELAPISDKAWAQIEEEASRTLKRHLAARRVVDVHGPKDLELSAVGTGHLRQIEAPGDGIQAAQREAKALVELRVAFELTRQAIDDVERGATDSDWSAVKDAAGKIAGGFGGKADMPRPPMLYRSGANDPKRTLAAKFAVMHNTAQTAMMRSVEPGHGNERALQSRPRTS